MAFEDFKRRETAVVQLQRSLERSRLAHAYLFTGPDVATLEAVACQLAKTLNCQAPPRRNAKGAGVESCDACVSCRKIAESNHPDVHWIRPESKSRIITIGQMRELMQTVSLKPAQSAWKVAVLVAADRMKEEASNAFLKTLEEPPGDTVFVLASSEPQRLLDTILSRCIRLHFSGDERPTGEPVAGWLEAFSRSASTDAGSLLGRYRLLSILLQWLGQARAKLSEELTRRSPLEKFEDVEGSLREKWEEELEAAIEAEYRHQRTRMLAALQWWFRDVWLASMGIDKDLFAYPGVAGAAQAVASRLNANQALGNLRQMQQTHQLLHTNVQEALALEVGMLKVTL